MLHCAFAFAQEDSVGPAEPAPSGVNAPAGTGEPTQDGSPAAPTIDDEYDEVRSARNSIWFEGLGAAILYSMLSENGNKAVTSPKGQAPCPPMKQIKCEADHRKIA